MSRLTRILYVDHDHLILLGQQLGSHIEVPAPGDRIPVITSEHQSIPVIVHSYTIQAVHAGLIATVVVKLDHQRILNENARVLPQEDKDVSAA